MKIKEILKKQGELYKNLTSNETIQKYNKKIEKSKPSKLVSYGKFPRGTYQIPEHEYKAITELEELLGYKAGIVYTPTDVAFDKFEISIQNNNITYLRISKWGELGVKNRSYLTHIPKQINNLANLQTLKLNNNKITEIKNLNNLTDLQELSFHSNKITEIKGLDNLTSLKKLELEFNQIKEIKNLDNLTDLQELNLSFNQIQEIKNLDNLQNLKKLSIYNNKINEIKGLDKLQNLKEIWLGKNSPKSIKNLLKSREEIKKLKNKGVEVVVI